MLSESTWKKEQSILEEDASNISILKKEITKQAEIDTSVQLTIKEKIEVLKQNATTLAKRLENQKHKNNQLQTIIKYMQTTMEKNKLQEATHKEDINYENITSLDNKYKKIQYDLGQINGKVNRLAENVEQKRNKINQNRTQRVIDSGIFRNIEKQLIDSELNFKKLLIEKVKYQREYERLLAQYKNLKEKAEIYGKQTAAKATKANNQEKDPPTIQPNLGRSYNRPKFTQLGLSKISPHSTLKYIQQQQHAQEQKRILQIHKILIQTGLDSCESLLHYFHNIDQINDKKFNQMNILTDQSNQIQRYLADIQKLKSQKNIKFYQTRRQLNKQQITQKKCKTVRNTIDITQKHIQKQITQFTHLFSQPNFKEFLKSMQITQFQNQPEDHLDLNKLEKTLQGLQKAMQQFLHPAETKAHKGHLKSQSTGRQNLDDIMTKLKKYDEFGKIMKKQQFEQEYRRIVKNHPFKSLSNQNLDKRKSLGRVKK